MGLLGFAGIYGVSAVYTRFWVGLIGFGGFLGSRVFLDTFRGLPRNQQGVLSVLWGFKRARKTYKID